MATSTFSSAPDNTNDTTFRAWVAAYIAAMAATGMVQTGDTGQINTSTVLKPTGANVVAGYVIFRFNDALQATVPLFVKMEFGTSANGATYPSLWLTVGKGSDGAGSIMGVLFARTGLYASTSSTTPYLGLASGGSGYSAVLPYTDWTGFNSSWYIIERSRDSSGNPTGDGIVVTYPSNSSGGANAPGFGPGVRAINYATGVSNWGAPPVVLPYQVSGVVMGTSSSISAGGISPIFPWVILAPSLVPWQSLACLTYPAGDNPNGIFTSRIFGTDHTYRSIPIGGAYYGFGVALQPATSASSGHQQGGLAIIWE